MIHRKIITPSGNLFKKVGNIIVRQTTKIKVVVCKYSSLFVEKIVTPLYISIAVKLKILKNVVLKIFKSLYHFFKFVFECLGSFFTSIINGVKMIVNNLNNLYFEMLRIPMKTLLRLGFLGNLVYTIYGLVVMCLPSLVCYCFYQERWFIIVSTIHTMMLIVLGYKHLNRIRKEDVKND